MLEQRGMKLGQRKEARTLTIEEFLHPQRQINTKHMIKEILSRQMDDAAKRARFFSSR